jgi:hypothetical protein
MRCNRLSLTGDQLGGGCHPRVECLYSKAGNGLDVVPRDVANDMRG